ncbi:MAG: GIY-YIG nuclease family protein [Firmicutes bacterium]|nr:GIY-YIG nuclease family protein [Bacillota bacterium]
MEIKKIYRSNYRTPEFEPVIYVYKIYKPDRFHYIKIGYTEMSPQTTIFMESLWASLVPEIIMIDTAVRKDGSILTCTEFHDFLKKRGYKELQSGIDHQGWFLCEPEDVIAAYQKLMEQ